MLEIGPNLQTFLLALVAAAIPAAGAGFALWIQAKKAAVSRDAQLGQIHVAVNSNMTAALGRIDKLEGAIADMLKARGSAQQASADQAGADSLKR